MQYLVVANQTLGGQKLIDSIRDRMARGQRSSGYSCRPLRSSPHRCVRRAQRGAPFDASGLPPANDDAREQGIAAAKENLDNELRRLREVGAVADMVGDPNPLTAIQKAVGERQFHEIILSTLAPGISRWLAMDLPHRIRRKVDVPLTVITATD